MGSPPKYEQIPSDDVYDHVGDVEAGLTNSTAQGADSVIYTYAPLFPRKGKTEHVVGLRGKDRQVSHGCCRNNSVDVEGSQMLTCVLCATLNL
jgi:hypothetical protein